MPAEFKNEAFINFSLPENTKAMETALARIASQKGGHYPLVIGGEKINTQSFITSANPSDFKEIIGTTASANVDLAEKAVQAALAAFADWQYVSPEERARYLFKAAAIMRRKKFEFSAWLVEEAGKNWAEADADTAEAIDFLEYYAQQMPKFAAGMTVVPSAGEQNECFYIPLGVGLIVPPWNFPLAILTGMTAAAIVTGNTVIMKPASTTPVIAAKLMELWEEVSLPPGVVNFLPGSGGAIGDYLVSHPKIRFINFTGSKEVGLRINKLAAGVSPGQKWIKRVVAEMGGKDAIIVDNEAELEDAANGIVNSAFGFQGQKCSACSRAIIVKDVYEEIVAKVTAKTKALTLGPASDPAVNLGPVIDKNAYDKILEYIEIGRKEGRIVAGGAKGAETGYFIEPTVIADVVPNARIAQEEIFGPVVALIKAEDFEQAIAIANDTEYGLTGAVYSQNRAKLEKARREFHVGNLYLNRKCTGALVGVHPFGGFNMSGTDSKAGGSDYLLLFLQAKSVAEKL
ncbi:L-glutamate gamma-semialdehyde dehydrogenase [Sporomusa sphaeroides]|uniref:L-glutamate gamma-semialdehyde dehydrogenase n=2 Tax=Sporomusa TaxID=2375 RepID=A0ABM9W3Z3_9FIRM|nr:L-glutamate gamma-semialdehyde dehydrogenase [Sporomusa sphaeroides]OLS58619.1 1-pyrroline-5-carboxylate dehydrogenase 1 [Sporomusa sphaeroides DSM 2875]CVK19871.1 1-pyrroline-5-carboxylate dehydrogenase 1 [Sporomusa sphaeroides DSM 2875]SCM80000.1 1-pyrroline-5-carboxylate dehydrogenase [uncultured Sporomusa sp.]